MYFLSFLIFFFSPAFSSHFFSYFFLYSIYLSTLLFYFIFCFLLFFSSGVLWQCIVFVFLSNCRKCSCNLIAKKSILEDLNCVIVYCVCFLSARTSVVYPRGPGLYCVRELMVRCIRTPYVEP